MKYNPNIIQVVDRTHHQPPPPHHLVTTEHRSTLPQPTPEFVSEVSQQQLRLWPQLISQKPFSTHPQNHDRLAFRLITITMLIIFHVIVALSIVLSIYLFWIDQTYKIFSCSETVARFLILLSSIELLVRHQTEVELILHLFNYLFL